jgi:hypothetical protein
MFSVKESRTRNDHWIARNDNDARNPEFFSIGQWFNQIGKSVVINGLTNSSVRLIWNLPFVLELLVVSFAIRQIWTGCKL